MRLTHEAIREIEGKVGFKSLIINDFGAGFFESSNFEFHRDDREREEEKGKKKLSHVFSLILSRLYLPSLWAFLADPHHYNF